jgi:hypothetical protein
MPVGLAGKKGFIGVGEICEVAHSERGGPSDQPQRTAAPVGSVN